MAASSSAASAAASVPRSRSALNGSATAAAVEALIENLTYANVSDAPVGSRMLTLNVADASGADLLAAGRPSFTLLPDAANPFAGIDVGRISKPEMIDFDGDGDLDLLIGQAYGTIRTFRNDGGGTFSELTGAANPFGAITGGVVTSFAFANFLGDANLDLLVGDTDGRFLAYRNDNGVFVQRTGVANPFDGIDVGGWADPVFIDADNDGDLDVIAGTQAGSVYLLRNNGGTFSNAGTLPITGIINSSPGTVDIDGDSDLDLVIGEFLSLRTYRNDGGVFTQVWDVPFHGLADFRHTPSFADLDGDGDLDGVFGDDQGRIRIFENAGQSIIANVTPQRDAPAGTDRAYLLFEDREAVLPASVFPFTDSDNDALLGIRIASAPTGGTLYFDADGAGGSAPIEVTDFSGAVTYSVAQLNAGLLTFVPTANLNGVAGATISFVVIDNGDTSGGAPNADPTPATLTFDISPVNDAPAGADHFAAMLEDGRHVFAASEFGFTDPIDGDALRHVIFTTLPGNGTIYYDDGTTRLAFGTAPGNIGPGTPVTVSDLDSGYIYYEPDLNKSGTGHDSFTFQVRDDGGTDDGGQDFDQSPNSFTFNVDPVNDAPVVTITPNNFAPAGAELQVNTILPGNQQAPTVATLSGGGLVVVYGSNYDLRFQRLDAAGSLVGAETAIASDLLLAPNDLTYGVAALADGGFVVAWQGPKVGNAGIFAQRFDAAGAAVGSVFGIQASDADAQQHLGG